MSTAHPLLRRLLSPTGFALVLCCFALPFVTVSCTVTKNQAVIATYRGVDLAVGNRASLRAPAALQHVTVDGAPLPSLNTIHNEMQPIGVQPLVLVVIALAVLGAAGVLLREPRARRLLAAATAAPAATVLVGAGIIGRRAAQDRYLADAAPLLGTTTPAAKPSLPPFASVGLSYGFWLALAMLVMLGAGNLAGLLRTDQPPAGTTPPEAHPGPADPHAQPPDGGSPARE